MEYRVLGKTKLTISTVGVGTWQFGGEWGQDYSAQEAAAIIGKARDEGINLIDTAECYGPDHLSESLVGQAIEGERENWIVASKFGHDYTGRFKRDDHYEPEQALKQLEASLRALRTDYIDILQFHSGPDEAFDNDALWEMLQRQVEAGKVRHLGVSIRRTPDAFQIEKGARDYGVSVLQVIYNRLYRDPEEKIFPVCEQYDIGILARVPLASGFLSGKYKPGQTFKDSDVRSERSQADIDRQLETVQKIAREEVPGDMPMAQWALAWCLSHPRVHCVIPGCKNVEQVASNAAAAALVPVERD